MNILRQAVLLIALTLCGSTLYGQFQAVSMEVRPSGFMKISEVKEGMKGTARTVFRGNRSEDFQVEILGVIPNWIGPRQDLIVGKLSGANAERTFVFAGMSGSPVYIDGKLVGAISYSFPFAKEPIAGITPIEQMVTIMEQKVEPTIAPRHIKPVAIADLTTDIWKPSFSAISRSAIASGFSGDSRLMAIAGQSLAQIATPVTFAGVSQKVLDALAPELLQAGILPVVAAGGSGEIKPMKKATDTTLLGGDSVVVQLARGDIQIAAAGTVTLREGNRIYAFGHPFFSLGSTDLPMAESHVITVVPNANNSFKLAVADAPVGTMTQDRATAIYGKLGQAPKMLPVKITLTTSRGRTEEVNFESAFDELLTPLIINAGMANTLSAHERSIGDSTIEVVGEIKIKGNDPIRINRRFAGPQAAIFAASAPAIPLAAMLRANFEGIEITGVTVDMKAVDVSRTAVLDRITADKDQVRPGESLEITAFERSESGAVVSRKIPIRIPHDVNAGSLTITVGDGNTVQQNSAITHFTPRSASDLISTLNALKRSDKLYAVLTRTSTGAIIGAKELPQLPPSMLATINNDRSAGGSKPSVTTVVAEFELPAGAHIVSGSQTLNIEVIR